MPGNILSADTGFPDLEKEGSTEEKLKTISSYLFMLLESLRYTLANLGVDNFNDHELELLSQTLTKPLQLEFRNVENAVATLRASAEGLAATVSDMSGDLSRVEQTANGLSSTVASVSEDMSTLRQSIAGVAVSVQTVDGRVTTIEQGIGGISVSQNDGQSQLSGVALEIKSRAGNVVGYFKRDENGEGTTQEARTRMFLGTQGNYVLKMESNKDTSYESKTGTIYLKAGDSILLTPGSSGSVRIASPNGTRYEFRDDGLYFNNVRIAP